MLPQTQKESVWLVMFSGTGSLSLSTPNPSLCTKEISLEFLACNISLGILLPKSVGLFSSSSMTSVIGSLSGASEYYLAGTSLYNFTYFGLHDICTSIPFLLNIMTMVPFQFPPVLQQLIFY